MGTTARNIPYHTYHKKTMHSALITALILSLVPAAVLHCRSTPPDKGPTGQAATHKSDVPADFFLVPAPFEPGERDDVMIDAFSAPLLDQGFILGYAKKFEARGRAVLQERMRATQTRLCELPPPERETLAGALGLELKAQHIRAESARLRREQQMRDLLEAEYRGYRLERALEARKLVSELHQERSRRIEQAWRQLLDGSLETKSRELCLAMPLPPVAPPDRLFLPLYEARYRFFVLLPGDFRARLILALHPAGTSDK